MIEDKTRQKKIIKYAVACLFGALLVFIALSSRNFSWNIDPAERYRMLCDAFTIPGLLFILLGVLVWLAGQGALDGLGYVGSYMIKLLVPRAAKKYGRYETYAEYIERKHENGKPKGYGFLFIVGMAFMAAAIVFLILFYKHFN